MDSKQIDHAMRHRLPVKFDGHMYERIIEYVAWYDNNSIRRLSVVLIKGRGLHRVPADKVELAEKE